MSRLLLQFQLTGSKLVEQNTKALESKDYERTVELINYYIKIDPFNIKMRELKISCLSRLGRKEDIAHEISVMTNYIGNKSIKELINITP